jgi:hypothetical protein
VAGEKERGESGDGEKAHFVAKTAVCGEKAQHWFSSNFDFVDASGSNDTVIRKIKKEGVKVCSQAYSTSSYKRIRISSYLQETLPRVYWCKK